MKVVEMEKVLSDLERKVVAAVATDDNDESQRLGIEAHPHLVMLTDDIVDFRNRNPHDPIGDELADRAHNITKVLVKTIFALPL